MYLIYDGLFQKLRSSYFRKVLNTYATTGCKLLDYGCGPGDMVAECLERNIQARGIDNSLRSVTLAKERGLEVALGDYTALPEDFRDFDVIFVHSVLEHVDRPLDLIEALTSRLASRGYLVLSAPTPEPGFWDDPTHVRPYTPKAFHTLGELCGLEVIEVNYVFAFLLGIRLTNSFFYRVLNLLPFVAGTNLLGVYRRPESDS